MKSYLAFDLGASSGRAILGGVEHGKLVLREVHRFPNNGAILDGALRWNLTALRDELKTGIVKAFAHGRPASMGIDTWGVDYALFDRESRKLLEQPYTYRDSRTENIRPAAFAKASKAELYRRTGIQDMAFNTVFQLFAHRRSDPGMLDRATFLHIPDALGFLLGGSFDTEYTDASTSGLLDAKKRDWDFQLAEKLDLPRGLFPRIVFPGASGGALSPELARTLGVPEIPIVKVGSHDTASAVAAVPAVSGGEFAYMSCGTWALLGAEIAEPELTSAAENAGFTNEGGLDRTIRFLTNIMGCWLFQECRRTWAEEGKNYGFGEMADLAAAAKPLCFRIDPTSAEFLAPGGMPGRIAEAGARSGRRPETDGEILRGVYDSLALCVRDKLAVLGGLRGREYSALHIVGGGTQDRLLMQLIADACGIPVLAGPIEATAVGNILAQMLGSGELSGLDAARHLVADSFEVIKYQPRDDMRRRYEQA